MARVARVIERATVQACSPLMEDMTRQEIIDKSRTETPDKFKRRTTRYVREPYRIHEPDLARGILNMSFRVSGLDQPFYLVTVEIRHINRILRKYYNPSRRLYWTFYHALSELLDSFIYVHCTCPDFKYRYSYIATKAGYGLATETRRPVKTNPHLKGSVCKHLALVLRILPTRKYTIAKDLEQIYRSRPALLRSLEAGGPSGPAQSTGSRVAVVEEPIS